MLADYDYYYAVRRFSATNITYLSRHAHACETVEAVTSFVANLIEPGKQRDAVLLRRFDHEIARLLEDDFLVLDRATQQLLHEGIGRLVAEHLTDDIAGRLGAETRIRMALTRDGALDDLLAAIRQDARAGRATDRGRAGPAVREVSGIPRPRPCASGLLFRGDDRP